MSNFCYNILIMVMTQKSLTIRETTEIDMVKPYIDNFTNIFNHMT